MFFTLKEEPVGNELGVSSFFSILLKQSLCLCSEASPPHVLTALSDEKWVWIHLSSWHFLAHYPLTLRPATSRKQCQGKGEAGCDKNKPAVAGIAMVTGQRVNDVSAGSHDSCHHRDKRPFGRMRCLLQVWGTYLLLYTAQYNHTVPKTPVTWLVHLYNHVLKSYFLFCQEITSI